MSYKQKHNGAPWLYSDETGDIAGVKDPDGSEFFFARKANYGLFRNMQDQSALANTPTAISFNSALIENGITIESDDEIHFARGGFFNFTLSARIENTDNQIHNFYMWGRKNGVDLDGTLTRTSIPESHGGNAGAIVLERTYFAPLLEGDYIQVMWMVDNANIVLQSTDADAGPPAMPSGPSVALSVYEVAF